MPIPKAQLAPETLRASKKYNITQKQAELALRYVTDDDTLGNKTQSGFATYNTEHPMTAWQLATATLANPKVQSYIQAIFERLDIGVEVRSSLLARIARGNETAKKTITRRNREGEVVEVQEIEAEIPHGVRIKALSELNRMDGTLERATAAVRIAEREYTSLQRKLLREAGVDVGQPAKGKRGKSLEQGTGEGGGAGAGG